MKRVVCLLAAITTLLGAEPKVGILKHGNLFEFSIIFPEAVDMISLQSPDSYAISGAEIVASRLTATNKGVILGATGLTTNQAGLLSINHVRDPALNELPPQSITFNTGARFWTGIGSAELGFPPDVTAYGTNGFDVFSGGIQQRDEYDEATFAGERVSGDFDVSVRVDQIDLAGLGAKAGIMVREDLDEGKQRPLNPDDPLQNFSRYIEFAISYPATASGDPGNNEHQIIARRFKGSIFTESLSVTNDAAPTLPNAWLRVLRVGNDFKMYRGINGVNWLPIGSASFTTAAPESLYVGVAFSPQNDDLSQSSGLRDLYGAKFRDFKLETSENRIAIRKVTGGAEVSWKGIWTLQTTTNLTNQWLTAPVQTTPQIVNLDDKARFFRLFRPN